MLIKYIRIVYYILFYVLVSSEIAKMMIEQVKEFLNERPREIKESTEDWSDDDWSNKYLKEDCIIRLSINL